MMSYPMHVLHTTRSGKDHETSSVVSEVTTQSDETTPLFVLAMQAIQTASDRRERRLLNSSKVSSSKEVCENGSKCASHSKKHSYAFPNNSMVSTDEESTQAESTSETASKAASRQQQDGMPRKPINDDKSRRPKHCLQPLLPPIFKLYHPHGDDEDLAVTPPSSSSPTTSPTHDPARERYFPDHPRDLERAKLGGVRGEHCRVSKRGVQLPSPQGSIVDRGGGGAGGGGYFGGIGVGGGADDLEEADLSTTESTKRKLSLVVAMRWWFCAYAGVTLIAALIVVTLLVFLFLSPTQDGNASASMDTPESTPIPSPSTPTEAPTPSPMVRSNVFDNLITSTIPSIASTIPTSRSPIQPPTAVPTADPEAMEGVIVPTVRPTIARGGTRPPSAVPSASSSSSPEGFSLQGSESMDPTPSPTSHPTESSRRHDHPTNEPTPMTTRLRGEPSRIPTTDGKVDEDGKEEDSPWYVNRPTATTESADEEEDEADDKKRHDKKKEREENG